MAQQVRYLQAWRPEFESPAPTQKPAFPSHSYACACTWTHTCDHTEMKTYKSFDRTYSHSEKRGQAHKDDPWGHFRLWCRASGIQLETDCSKHTVQVMETFVQCWAQLTWKVSSQPTVLRSCKGFTNTIPKISVAVCIVATHCVSGDKLPEGLFLNV